VLVGCGQGSGAWVRWSPARRGTPAVDGPSVTGQRVLLHGVLPTGSLCGCVCNTELWINPNLGGGGEAQVLVQRLFPCSCSQVSGWAWPVVPGSHLARREWRRVGAQGCPV